MNRNRRRRKVVQEDARCTSTSGNGQSGVHVSRNGISTDNP